MLKKVFVCVVCLIMATSVFATETWWGGWVNNDFFTAGNWTGGLPGPSTEVKIGGGAGASNLVITNSPSTWYGINNISLGLGTTGSALCTITMNGGSISISNNLEIGELWASSPGTFTLNGGDVSAMAVYIGHHGSGVLNINGGTFSPWGLLKLGGHSGTGIINVNGGLITAAELNMVDSSQKIIISSGLLDITSAWGSQSQVLNYISDGWISAGAGKTLQVSTYTAPSGNTGYRITAIPEPVTLILLTVGGLFLKKRKYN